MATNDGVTTPAILCYWIYIYIYIYIIYIYNIYVYIYNYLFKIFIILAWIYVADLKKKFRAPLTLHS